MHFLVLDIGTTGVKAFVFDGRLAVLSRTYVAIQKNRPHPGWVEQRPAELIRASIRALRTSVRSARVSPRAIHALGIANQRETTIAWDAQSGRALSPAIVWEDRRTDAWCRRAARTFGAIVRARSGLPFTSYGSAPKIRWLFDHVPAVAHAYARGMLRVGTVDSWILFNLADGQPHVTDMTNASRTLIFDIRRHVWDDDLLTAFGIPRTILPDVRAPVAVYGELRNDILGRRIPIRAVCGDQQASAYAAGSTRGTTKVTYGTGTFIMQITGMKRIVHPKFFTTLVPTRRGVAYALEAKIDRTGEQNTALLHDDRRRHAFLRALVLRVAALLKELPIRSRRITVDGGMTRDSYLARAQARAARCAVRVQSIPDGTAFGIAKLLRDSLR